MYLLDKKEQDWLGPVSRTVQRLVFVKRAKNWTEILKKEVMNCQQRKTKNINWL
jgi:hypothetical protein